MIRTQVVLLRMVEEFFRNELLPLEDGSGIYRWDRARIAAPELRDPIPPNVDIKTRRRMMAEREGRGKYLEKELIAFGPWEIVVYSSAEQGPLGEATLRDRESHQIVVSGPLDAATWRRMGDHIRNLHQRKAS
jgi:hypothetical protein